MSAKSKIDPVKMQTFNCASLTASFQVVFAGGFSTDLAVFKMYNSGTTDVTLSYNGVDDQDMIPSGGSFILDIQANKEGERCAWPKGREVFVKGTAAAGTIYVTGYTIKRS